MYQEVISARVQLKDVEKLELHNIAAITGRDKKYCVIFRLSEYAQNESWQYPNREEVSAPTFLTHRTRLSEVRVFRTIEQAIQVLEDANLLKKFTIEVALGNWESK